MSKLICFLCILLCMTGLEYSNTNAASDETVVAVCDKEHFVAALKTGGNITFSCSGTIETGNNYTIKHDVTIDGTGQNIVLTNPLGSGSFLLIEHGAQVKLQNLTMTSYFGKLLANAGKLVVKNVTFSNMNWDVGSVIYNTGNLEVANSTFEANYSTYGGGAIFNSTYGIATISNSTFRNNRANYGGAVFNGGTMAITNSVFSGNQVQGFSPGDVGGAIANSPDAKLTIQNSTFVDNKSYRDGGAVANVGYLDLRSSYLGNNTAGGAGGAVKDNGGITKLSNLTLYSNHASGDGGGIYALGVVTATSLSLVNNSSEALGDNLAQASGSITLHNSLVSGSVNDNCAGLVTDAGYNLEDGAACGFDANQHSISNTDPQLDPLGPQDNGGPTLTVALQNGSPAIDAGHPNDCMPTDQRGHLRPQDANGDEINTCDIGAFEVVAVGKVRATKLTLPKNGASIKTGTVLFKWQSRPWVARYQIEIYRDAIDGQVIKRKSVPGNTFQMAKPSSGTFYWRVRTCNEQGCSGWSTAWRFVVP